METKEEYDLFLELEDFSKEYQSQPNSIKEYEFLRIIREYRDTLDKTEYDRGHEMGYSDGYDSHTDDDYKEGYDAGYDEGYDRALIAYGIGRTK